MNVFPSSKKVVSLLLLSVSPFFFSQTSEQTPVKRINTPSEIWPTNKNKRGDYFYEMSISSFPGYPAENAGSYFTTAKGNVAFGKMSNTASWPSIKTALAGDDHHALPRQLHVAWFSPLEDKFYEGTFNLDTAELKKDFDKMWRQYPNDSPLTAGMYDRYSIFSVGVAPGGQVVLWLSSYTRRKIIGTFQAKETNNISWKKFATLNGIGAGVTREDYVSTAKENAATDLPDKLQQYAKTYNWRPRIEFAGATEQQTVQPLKFDIYYNNGEEESQYHLYEKENNYKLRAVPKKIIFRFKLDDDFVYGTGIEPEEDDAYRAFESMAANSDDKTELVIRIDNDMNVSEVLLRNGNRQHKLNVVPKAVGKAAQREKIDALIE